MNTLVDHHQHGKGYPFEKAAASLFHCKHFGNCSLALLLLLFGMSVQCAAVSNDGRVLMAGWSEAVN